MLMRRQSEDHIFTPRNYCFHDCLGVLVIEYQSLNTTFSSRFQYPPAKSPHLNAFNEVNRFDYPVRICLRLHKIAKTINLNITAQGSNGQLVIIVQRVA